MLEPPKTDRLIALLRAQRDEAVRLAAQTRDSSAWTAASERLASLNDQIMHVGAFGSAAFESVGDGLELDLDSRPVDDAHFRRAVVTSVRQAFAIVRLERLALRIRVRDRRAAGPVPLHTTRDLIISAEATLHRHYPDATLHEDVTPADPDMITLRAERGARLPDNPS